MKWSKAVEYIVKCEKCGKVDFIQTIDGEYRATDTPKKFFSRAGWSDYYGATLCPACTSKLIKGETEDE